VKGKGGKPLSTPRTPWATAAPVLGAKRRQGSALPNPKGGSGLPAGGLCAAQDLLTISQRADGPEGSGPEASSRNGEYWHANVGK
jgi:hypothetical protein